jgi:hypothetical protein
MSDANQSPTQLIATNEPKSGSTPTFRIPPAEVDALGYSLPLVKQRATD